jgi:hypothetical protein
VYFPLAGEPARQPVKEFALSGVAEVEVDGESEVEFVDVEPALELGVLVVEPAPGCVDGDEV